MKPKISAVLILCLALCVMPFAAIAHEGHAHPVKEKKVKAKVIKKTH